MLTLTVSLDVRPGHLEDFLAAIIENATRAFTDEWGCVYFDVCQDVSDELHFIFHEVYVDQEAIDVHRRAPHFAAWQSAADLHVVPGSQKNTIARRLSHHN